MLVCPRGHDVSEAEPGQETCPVCGRSLIEAPNDMSVPLVEITEPKVEPPADTIPIRPPPPEREDVEPEVVPPSVPELPDPALICAKVPDHDIGNRAPNAGFCPHPGCGGALIQLQCEKNLAHDVASRRSGQSTCPVCDEPLITWECTFNAAHSMVDRSASQTTCPVCGHELKRFAPQWSTEQEQVEKRPWWRRHRKVLGGGAVAALVVAAVLVWALRWPGLDPNRPLACDVASIQRASTGSDISPLWQIAELCKAQNKPDLRFQAVETCARREFGICLMTMARGYDPEDTSEPTLFPRRSAALATQYYRRAHGQGVEEAQTRLDSLCRSLRQQSNDAALEASC
jgi:hypothetical protein